MTAANLLDSALAILATSRAQSPEYTDYALPLINLLLAETFECNNSIRAYKGLETLSEVYAVAELGEKLACEQELARVALPLGLCARLVMDDDDMAKAAYYHNQYVTAIEDAGRWTPGKIIDVYGGGGA